MLRNSSGEISSLPVFAAPTFFRHKEPFALPFLRLFFDLGTVTSPSTFLDSHLWYPFC